MSFMFRVPKILCFPVLDKKIKDKKQNSLDIAAFCNYIKEMRKIFFLSHLHLTLRLVYTKTCFFF